MMGRLLSIAVLMLIGMTLFEFLKQLLLPGITAWESHFVTIIFTSALAVAAAYGAVRFYKTRRGSDENLLRKSQQLQQAIVDNSFAIIYVKDREGRYLLINRRFEELFHVTRDVFIGKADPDIFPKEFADAFRAVDQSVLAAGTAIEVEEEAPQDDGMHTFLSIKVPLFDAEAKPYAVCGISTDITERKRGEQEVRRLNEELLQKIVQLQEAREELMHKEKLAMLGLVAGGIGNELRNPLGVMNNAVFFLQSVMPEADETVREYLDIIKKEIDNSLWIITDLLDFTRAKTPQAIAVTARALTDASLDRCMIPENIDLQVEIPFNLPCLRADPLQMKKVLQNLITNAVQAMPDGGALRIGACCLPGAAGLVSTPKQGGQPHGVPLSDFLEISIADTGEGIAPVNMTRLFQPLFTTKSRGIGLGLSICKSFVEANGGRIEVESEQGKGTTFTVALPVEDLRGE